MKYTAIRSEGGLIPYDLLEQIANEQVPGQKPADFGLSKDRRLSDEIQRVWSDAQDFWDVFRRRMASSSERDPYGTSETRERWIYPLLSDPQTFGYGLKLQSSAIAVNGANFPISHLADESPDSAPVHIEGFKVDLDHRRPNLRTSPRAMVQEFLNRGESRIWGIVTNGLRFLLLRNSARTARPTYLEFDLQTILEGNHFHEFALFYRLCHRSRLPRAGEDPTKCLLEQYYQLSVEQGGRVREKLRVGVEEALKILGTGFLRHPANTELREKTESGKLKADEYHRQLLRLVYRLLFLMVAEERRLIAAAGEDAERRQRIYDDFYSVARLRERAEDIVEEGVFSDLWIGLKLTFSLFSDTRDQNPLGIPPLNGELFSYRAIPDLEGTELYNHDLLRAIRRLSLFREDKILHRVNYSALDVEELGSVYESLLDFQPLVAKEAEGPRFELHEGGERKSTGSYYTRPELVRELIQSALVPVIEDRLAEAEKESKGRPEAEAKAVKERALLGISVCDPACGSGHFLLEAARRLGRELARIQTGQDEPAPGEFHLAVRDAISHCIYGVDLNPLAVDLCKLALWLEGHWIGKPLTFLDHRIKCGNSLIGVLDPSTLEKGIPDQAFSPVTGDDKKTASAYRKRNKKEREMLLRRLDFEGEAHLPGFAKVGGGAMDFPEDKPEDVRRKEELYRKGREQKEWLHDWTTANLWTAAFFVPLTKYDDPIVPTEETFMDYLRHGKDRPQMTGYANALFCRLRFFHWRLEFPEVFAGGGFDVVLGNPPWERPEFHEEEHWADDPHIVGAKDKAERAARIEEYRLSSDATKRHRVERYHSAQHELESQSKYWRGSGRFPLTAKGKFNTYALFAELAKGLLRPRARFGLILQSGIGTDITCKAYLDDLVSRSALISFFDFVNLEGFFPGIHRTHPHFCAITVSSEQNPKQVEFAFYLTRTDQLTDRRRRFQLNARDVRQFNPNTGTFPTFRTRVDAALCKSIYDRVPILLHSDESKNEWNLRITRIFNMGLSAVVKHSRTSHDLETAGLTKDRTGNFRDSGRIKYWRVYESKMIHQYNHRYATYDGCDSKQLQAGQPIEMSEHALSNSDSIAQSRFWLPDDLVSKAFRESLPPWLMVFRDVTNATNERTMIAAVIPFAATDFTLRVVLTNEPLERIACLFANFNSMVFDYLARQFVAGTHLSDYVTEQLPVLRPSQYLSTDTRFLLARVAELTFTASDLQGVGEQFGYEKPFGWRTEPRQALQAELDAYYAHLYGLTRDELRYILDPKDVFGEDFPSETFRVLKEKEEKEYGEYRTRRLVLAAYDALTKTDRFAGEKRESAIEAPKSRSMVQV